MARAPKMGALYISIHALHEESDPFANAILFWTGISIHALHEESDVMFPSKLYHATYFNPRSP